MALNTYNDLLSSAQAWLEDDDAEFSGSLNDIVDLAEKRVLRDLDLAIFRRVDSTATMTASVATVAKPTIAAPDLLVAGKAIWLTGGALAGAHFLINRSMEYITDYNAGATDGVPKFYGEQDETTWVFGRPPDATYTVNVRYLSRPVPLAVANQTNWLSDNVYDFLFKAVLAESEKNLKGDERIPVWEADYMGALPKVRRELYPLFGNQFDSLGADAVPQAPRSASQ